MGTFVELNDTLQLTTAQGFPADIFDFAAHSRKPVTLDQVRDCVFKFHNKPSARIFQLDPVRVFYVHNIDGKWLFWGHVLIQSLSIEKAIGVDGTWNGNDWVTSGTYRVENVYDPAYQRLFTEREAPADRNYFLPAP